MPIMMGESWLAGTWIHCIPVRKQRAINAGVPLVSPCSVVLAPSTGNRATHMWAALPTSKNLIYRCLTDRTRRFVAMLILNPIKLTMEMNPPCRLWKVFRRLASMPCVFCLCTCLPASVPTSVYAGLRLYRIVMSALRIHGTVQRVQLCAERWPSRYKALCPTRLKKNCNLKSEQICK